MKNEKIKNDKGFTLLFSILVSVLILSVGTSMISITLKQLILSGSGRESQFAFYAANTGIECALYWDLHPQIEPGGSVSHTFPASGQSLRDDFEGVTCDEGQIKTGVDFSADSENEFTTFDSYVWDTSFNTYPNDYTFRMSITNSDNNTLYCTQVTVSKELYSKELPVDNRVKTTITSRGLNTCNPNENARAVERALVLEYVS